MCGTSVQSCRGQSIDLSVRSTTLPPPEDTYTVEKPLRFLDWEVPPSLRRESALPWQVGDTFS
jgi:hypothetical protein